MNKRTGFYSWAGPGTIRMTNLKFFNPKIDHKSLMASYDYDYLAKAKEKFALTDVWATYSWGFSEEKEKEDRLFLIKRIPNFKKLGLKLHAYIQGPTLVYKDYPDIDWYCKDNKDRYISYHRGRRMVCINNPGFVEYLTQKILKTKGLGFDGIFLDNMVMGQMPLPFFIDKLPVIFVGCRCTYCLKLFRELTGKEIPIDMEKDIDLTKEYLNFRTQSMTKFIKKMADLVHSLKMDFGTNSYDPKFNSKIMYGLDLKEINKIQDYILFENFSLPSASSSINNDYIEKIARKFTKPVFVVSYKYGIGSDSEFSQRDINSIYSEDQGEKFHINLKGSEYYTHHIWHNLYLEHYDKPSKNKPYPHHISTTLRKTRKLRFIFKLPFIKRLVKENYNPIVTLVMENKTARSIVTSLSKIGLIIHRNYYDFTKNFKHWLTLTVLSLVAIFGYYEFTRSVSFLSVSSFASANIGIIIAFLLVIKTLGILIPPFSGGIFTLAAIPILGWEKAYLIDLAGNTIGNTIDYWISYTWGEKFLDKIFSKNFSDKVRSIHLDQKKELAGLTVLALILGGTMIELVSYSGGFIKAKYKNVILAVTIGQIVWGLPSFFIVGNLFKDKGIAVNVAVIAVAIFISIRMKKRYLVRFIKENKE